MVADPFGLEAWLREHWMIVPDPEDAEFIKAPVYMIQCAEFWGDCDDAATLAASTLYALGIPSLLVATRQADEDQFSHVFVRLGPEWRMLEIDPIVPPEHMPIPYREAMIVSV